MIKSHILIKNHDDHEGYHRVKKLPGIQVTKSDCNLANLAVHGEVV